MEYDNKNNRSQKTDEGYFNSLKEYLDEYPKPQNCEISFITYVVEGKLYTESQFSEQYMKKTSEDHAYEGYGIAFDIAEGIIDDISITYGSYETTRWYEN